MANIQERLGSFVVYAQKLEGDEKGEAQIFLDHLFKAFGYEDGIKEAGATLEERVKNKKKRTTHFADLVWRPRVLIEMKRSGADLNTHYQQAFNYWVELVPDRPRYVILCNFDEFWIYDFNLEIYEPQDKVKLEELPSAKASVHTCFNFIFASVDTGKK